jgi:PAS domain S-box-containing protein
VDNVWLPIAKYYNICYTNYGNYRNIKNECSTKIAWSILQQGDIVMGDKVNRTTFYDCINSYKTLRINERNNYVIFLESMLIGIFISLIIEKVLWWKGTVAVHLVLELICIVFNMSLFFIVWNKYEDSPGSSKLIAFGLLSTTIFDVLHIYYFGPLGFAFGRYSDLGPKFWVLGRLTEIIMIFAASFSYKRRRVNRWIAIIIAVAVPLIILHLNMKYTKIFPKLFDDMGLTKSKILLESIIIILAIVSVLMHGKKNNEEGYISYRYLTLAILVIIPTEICFMLYKSYTSPIVVYGHVFRIAYCYFLYKSIFQSSINYPYEQLKRSKKRLNNILDALPIGILTFDNDLKLDFANRQYEKLLSCNRKDIIGLTNKELLEVFNRLDDIVEEPLVDRVVQGSKDIKNVIRTYLAVDGKSVKLQTDAEQIEDGVFLMVKDTRIEQEIDNLHLQTHAILNSMKSAAFICDNGYNILAVNNSFEELIGLSSDRLIGVNIIELSELMNYQRKQNDTSQDNKYIIDEQFEATFTNNSGIKKEVIIHRSDILNIYNETVGKIAVVTDITELKEQQEKILHNEKLALLGQMGATIVHETRNFLTTIKGCSQLIENLANHDKVAEYARKINTNTDEVNRIISDFLSLSKPKQTTLEEVAVYDLLKSMEATLETSSLIKGVYMEILYNIDERYVLCDGAQMRQVILNICKNAIEAMGEVPYPKLTIEAGITEENDNIYIKISDNGKGMNEETLAKIGTLFFTTKQSGTGLGLSVCYDIIKQHGGWIDTTSKEGIGTTFTINIPGIEDDELEEVLMAAQIGVS